MFTVGTFLLRLAALILVLGASSTADAQGSERGARLASVFAGGTVPSGLGVNIHFTDGHRADLLRIHEMGFRVVRMDMIWELVERQRGTYDWSHYDALVNDLRTAKLTPLLILDYANPIYVPGLAASSSKPSPAYAALLAGAPRAGFLRFVHAAAARYGRNVVWEIWNEPDLNFGQPIDTDGYVGLAMESCRRIRSTVPDARVIGPAASNFAALPLLRRFVAADRARCFDAISVHPYRNGPPESVLQDWASLFGLAECANQPSCPALVSSEWGYAVTSGAATAERQANYVTRVYLLNLLAGVPLSVVYDWQNDGTDPDDKEANFGVIDHSGVVKSAGLALGRLVQQLAGLAPLGRVETPDPNVFVVAFGAGRTVRKLAGWTSDGAAVEVSLPARACIDPPQYTHRDGACSPNGPTLPDAVHMRLSGSVLVVANRIHRRLGL